MLVNVFRHEILLLLRGHRLDTLDLGGLNHVVVSNLLDVEEHLGPLAMVLRQVFVHVVNFASLGDTGQFGGLVGRQSLLLTVARLIVE